jgi:hypothetical protein
MNKHRSERYMSYHKQLLGIYKNILMIIFFYRWVILKFIDIFKSSWVNMKAFKVFKYMLNI